MAAQRFGGKYSPQARGDTPDGAPPPEMRYAGRSRAGFRVNLLFVLPAFFLVAALRAEPLGLALNLACFGALMVAAWLTREGLIAEDAYAARKVARRPAVPRKLLGSALTGIGLACAGLADGSLVNAIVFGGLGAMLHLLAFGPDPLGDKGMDSVDRFQSDRVARVVDEAEAHLAAMSEAIARAKDRPLEARVERFQATARRMFRAVEDDPRDLAGARKYLGVYLLGARDATVKFADLYARRRDPQARADYVALLDDLESNFGARTEALLLDDRTDLNIEIEVLRERLAQET